MAKADAELNTAEWMWLREALELAVASLGSTALAKERLVEWMAAAATLPWTCVLLKTPKAADLEKSIQGLTAPIQVTAYGNGDPRFMAAHLEIDWDENTAREIITIDTDYGKTWCYGAQAQGIRVSHTHLDALLPAAPHTDAAKVLEPKAWLAWARKTHSQKPHEKTEDYVLRLHGEMKNATNVTEVWTFETFRRRYFEARKAELHATFPRTV